MLSRCLILTEQLNDTATASKRTQARQMFNNKSRVLMMLDRQGALQDYLSSSRSDLYCAPRPSPHGNKSRKGQDHDCTKGHGRNVDEKILPDRALGIKH